MEHAHVIPCSTKWWSGRGRKPQPWCERFYAKVRVLHQGGDFCLLWGPALRSVEQGKVYRGVSVNFQHNVPGWPKQMSAWRWIWLAERGEIPQGWDIEHICGVSYCVKLGHLRAEPSKLARGMVEARRSLA